MGWTIGNGIGVFRGQSWALGAEGFGGSVRVAEVTRGVDVVPDELLEVLDFWE